MQDFFAPKKAPNTKPEEPMNKWGFPESLCVYGEDVRTMVYRPPGYGDRSKPFCKWCYLRPCILQDKQANILGFAQERELFSQRREDRDPEVVAISTKSYAEGALAEIYGMDFIHSKPFDRKRLPWCVLLELKTIHDCPTSSDWEWDDDWDEEDSMECTSP